MFNALLLSIWYELSDVKLSEALDDRASFCRFCGFSAHEATPERTAFVRFRRLLFAHQLDRALFEALTMQLKSKAVTVKTGTLVDATIIASASVDDDDARWVKHKGITRYTLSRELRAMGYRKLTARPRHRVQKPDDIAASKKASLPAWRQSAGRSRPAHR